MSKKLPNILITGTPGTGKTTLAERVAAATGLRHINVTELAKEKDYVEEYDEELDTFIIDEDKVCDELEPLMQMGGCIIDYHTCGFFPERWFDRVFVTRTDNTLLFDRLAARGYNQRKVSENVTCEIMQVVLEEAAESYRHDILVELQSDNVTQMEQNIAAIVAWVNQQR
eukprot:EC721870.1.p1 GENE.EC721870.1~~EC721870.1.p1  ORF type:complete len:170 (+),score=36.32 EC721870.1:47-556(+)